MIYLVTKQTELFEAEEYKCITVEESLEILKQWEMLQFDSETSGGFN